MLCDCWGTVGLCITERSYKSHRTFSPSPTLASLVEMSAEAKRAITDLADWCLHQITAKPTYDVEFPPLPLSPLLYMPKAVAAMHTTVGQSAVLGIDVQASGSTSLLNDISLVMFPTNPWDVEATTAWVEARANEAVATATKDPFGRLSTQAAPAPAELHPHDEALLTPAYIDPAVNPRALPSLTLLQAPLYTELGVLSARDRAAARLEREERSLKKSLMQQATVVPATVHHGEPATDAASRRREGETKAFKNCRSLDVQRSALVTNVVKGVLGLDVARIVDMDQAAAATMLQQHAEKFLLLAAKSSLSSNITGVFWNYMTSFARTIWSGASASAKDAVPNGVPALTVASLHEWEDEYVALFRRCGNLNLLAECLRSEQPSLLQALHDVDPATSVLKDGETSGKIVLAHVTKPHVTPLTVLPFFGSIDDDPTPAYSVRQQVSLQQFHNQPQLPFNKSNVTLRCAVDENNRVWRVDEDSAESVYPPGSDMCYTQSDTGFSCFKHEIEHKATILCTIRDNAVHFVQIGKSHEYHRDISRRVEGGKKHLILWEDDDEEPAVQEETHENSRKRPREE